MMLSPNLRLPASGTMTAQSIVFLLQHAKVTKTPSAFDQLPTEQLDPDAMGAFLTHRLMSAPDHA